MRLVVFCFLIDLLTQLSRLQSVILRSVSGRIWTMSQPRTSQRRTRTDTFMPSPSDIFAIVEEDTPDAMRDPDFVMSLSISSFQSFLEQASIDGYFVNCVEKYSKCFGGMQIVYPIIETKVAQTQARSFNLPPPTNDKLV